MLSEELKSVRDALGKLLGKVDPDSAEVLRICRRNLAAASDDARNMEDHFFAKETA